MLEELKRPADAEPLFSGRLAPECAGSDRIERFFAQHNPPTPCVVIDLSIGDAIDFLSAGAYTASYAAVEFNGFTPIRTYCI